MSKSDAKWSWPSVNMWRVGSENVLHIYAYNSILPQKSDDYLGFVQQVH